MQSSSALMPVSIFLVRSVGKLQTSKFMTAASKVSVTQKILQPVPVRCSGADRHALDCVWGHDHIQNSILNDYSDKNYEMEVEKLKQQIRLMLQNVSAPAKQLELIDDLQRLGVAYHFDKEIKIILERIYKSEDYWAETDLHTAALTFRLLRQNGYFVTQDIFKSFINNDSGIFKLSLREDIKGMLSLYEASYLSIEGIEGETIMEQALDFTTACFRNLKISKKKGFYSLPTLRNTWITLLRSYLNEARWYHQGYQPTLEEYMSNARISVGVYSMTIHAYIFDPKPVSEAELKYLESDPEILKWAAVIFRVCNDLGTSPEELKSGDTPKSVQCHMHDTRASKEVAEVQIRDLVRKGWKEMNTIRYKTEMIMQWRTIDKFLDTARASLRIYQYMNRNGMQDSMTKNLISKILHDPISL